MATSTASITEEPSSSWMDEQAAEYQDLVGSFVESVHDDETDEMVEYQLIWEGGDLGVALTPMENVETKGVMVSRVTGKGFPFGIKNVGPGDVLLSINLMDTTKMTLDQVVAYLQECDLPATLRFKKISPDLDYITAQPRPSHVMVTTGTASDLPTSPIGSSRPPSLASLKSSRFSQNSMLQQQQRRSSGSNRPSVQYVYSSMSSQPDVLRASDPSSTAALAAQKSANDLQQPTAVPPPAPTSAPVQPSQSEATVGVTNGMGLVSILSESESDHESVEEEDEEAEALDTVATPGATTRRPLQHMTSSNVSTLSSAPLMESVVSDTPILPQTSIDSGVMAVDGVMSPSDVSMEEFDFDEDISPIGHAVQPATLPSTRVSESDMNKPRDSVRLTIGEGGVYAGEPMMKAQPLSVMHELCSKGNLRGVMQHLKVNGPDALVHREPNHGQSCLHLAVKSGNVQLVKLILEQFDPPEELVHMEDDKGNTALHFAATKTPGMVHLLLESGRSANVKNSRKLTPLIISVITSKQDNVIIPRMLLKYGANPNDMHESQTVIHTAIASGKFQIAGALVRAGAKLDVEDSEGRTVFEKCDRKSLRFLLTHIYFPPTYITEKERSACMLCDKKIKFGHRKNNCTHCGRFCCTECSSLSIEMYKFPMGFPGRLRKGAAVRDLKKVCKTCYGVFKERLEGPKKEGEQTGGFLNRVIGVEWDEVNPNKLQKAQGAGRRGERY